jgi:hypothetical protein
MRCAANVYMYLPYRGRHVITVQGMPCRHRTGDATSSPYSTGDATSSMKLTR